ncbi:MAG: amino acid permease [Vicinamibacteraceae bacterium]|nr:amino acid permease [Vicinamibacteraceae bacterium]
MAAPPASGTLRRSLGRWDLTAIGINQVIGGAIFLMPSQVVAVIGGWSPMAFVLAGGASMLVALAFAEVSSRFDGTGGAYLFTRTAFGRFVGFEVGWMQWFTRVTSHASVANGIALALGYYAPAMAGGAPRVLLLTVLFAFFAWVNVRGIRLSALVVNTLTIGKLVPLGLFILVGLPHVPAAFEGPLPAIGLADASAAALLLIFVFGGFDVVPVPSGEASDPRRHVPFALVWTIIIVTVVMTAAQVVSMAVVDDLARSATPVADAAAVLAGAAGALVIGVGSIVSMLGNNAGQVLTGSRMLYAMAEQGDLPGVFARIHPRFRTPALAIVFTSVLAWVLAISGSFAVLATTSAVARLVAYTGTAASTLALRRERPDVGPARFRAPGGALIPILAILVSLVILAGASRAQLLGGAIALAAGAALFLVSPARRAQ